MHKGTQRRLSWPSGYPAPFESGWSIFMKIAVANYLNLDEIAELIKFPNLSLKAFNPSNFAKSNWIDFDKFSNLLGVDKKRLQMGFWDTLGIKPQLTRYEMRHCPQCWKTFGYHCILFDASFIESCPWHRCKLTPSCEHCNYPGTFLRTAYPNAGRTSFNPMAEFLHGSIIRGGYTCYRCGYGFCNLAELMSAEPMNSNHACMVIGYCRELIDWWQEVGKRNSLRDGMLGDIMRIGRISDEKKHFISWKLGSAFQSVSIDLSWRFKIQALEVRSYSWVDTHVESEKDNNARLQWPEFRIRDEVGLYYRSLRRSLYKLYVRKHRRCVRSLASVEGDERLCLDGSKICTVSLAFLIWRMSIEKIILTEGLHYKRNINYLLRLPSPDYQLEGLTLETRIRWCHFHFLSIWHQLNEYCGKEYLRVELGETDFTTNILWKHNSIIEELPAGNRRIKTFFDVIVPDASGLYRSQQKCCLKLKRGDEFIDSDSDNWRAKRRLCVAISTNNLYTHRQWSWKDPYENDHRKCMFLIRHSNPDGLKGQFRYLGV